MNPRILSACRRTALAVVALASLVLISGPVRAQQLFFASMDGSQETPPNGSPGSGLGVVSLNAAQDQITVTLDFNNLLGTITAADIDQGAPGSAGPMIFPIDVSLATGHNSGAIGPQFFAITPAQVGVLESGGYYMNIHSTVLPGGEIRGQLIPQQTAVPEPSEAAVMGIGVAGLFGLMLAARRRRTVAAV